MRSDNATGADNQQERLLSASRILRDHTPDSSRELKIWSHLHGDMQGGAPLAPLRPSTGLGKALSEIPCRVSE